MGQKKRDRTTQWRQKQIQKVIDDSFKATMEIIERKKNERRRI